MSDKRLFSEFCTMRCPHPYRRSADTPPALWAHGDGGGDPVWGHVTDGNRSDRLEAPLPDHPAPPAAARRGEPLLVADRKVCAGADHDLGDGAPLPLCAAGAADGEPAPGGGGGPELGALPRLWERPGRTQEGGILSRHLSGASVSGRRRLARGKSCPGAFWWSSPPNWPRPKPRA